MPVQLLIEQPSGLCAVLESSMFGGCASFDELARSVRNLDPTTRPAQSFLTFTNFVFRDGRMEMWRGKDKSVAPKRISDVKPKDYNFKRVWGTGEWLYGFRTVNDLYAIDNLRLYAPGLFDRKQP